MSIQLNPIVATLTTIATAAAMAIFHRVTTIGIEEKIDGSTQSLTTTDRGMAQQNRRSHAA
jgi:hypothetical protein